MLHFLGASPWGLGLRELGLEGTGHWGLESTVQALGGWEYNFELVHNPILVATTLRLTQLTGAREQHAHMREANKYHDHILRESCATT